jgi:hypothetical protein
MSIKASWRSALIIIAGLWLCLAGPIRAEDGDAGASDATANTTSDPTADAAVTPNKPVRHRAKKPASAHSQQPGKAASKASASPDDAASPNIPPSVFNANAQLQDRNSPADGALRAVPGQAESMMKAVGQSDPADTPTDAPAANAETGASDQLNDADRSLIPDRAPAPALVSPALTSPGLAMAQTRHPASDIDSTWSRTSMIGKIFVAFGGLLTLASAARMFMA